MPHFLRRCSICLVLFIAVVTAPTFAQTPAPSLALERQAYIDAVAAIERGDLARYEQLRVGLDDYPLALYLDYQELSRDPGKVGPAQARQFIDLSVDTPLPNRFLSVYLYQAGRDRRWHNYLTVMPDEPNSIELKCYYFRAKLATGDVTAAWEGAARLWVYGKSRPKHCDPLFDAWLKAGQLTDELVWERQLKAFDERQRSLLAYVGRKGSDKLKPWSEKLLAVYRHPEHIRQLLRPANDPYSIAIASHGLALLARYNPQSALREWQYFQTVLNFSDSEQQRVVYAIARYTLFAKTVAHKAWLQQALATLGDDGLTEIRLRWALEEEDWIGLGRVLPLLSEAQQGEGVWQYWGTRVMLNAGNVEQAMAQLERLAGQRGYYGFLAADELGKAYAFEHEKVPPVSATPTPQQLLAMRRIEELYFHQEDNLAHSEWFKMLQDSEGAKERIALASLAAQKGWHRMAIDAANQAKAWNLLDLRFPTPYLSIFEHYGAIQRVPRTELMAIARRESAFYHEAQSSAGARGLMQIMPATGKQVAASLGEPHKRSDLFIADHNVMLGSAYYRQLLDRFGGNRVFATASYNAGPHRVGRWRNKVDNSLPAEIWIETIPFKETRNYVQAVLSYDVVFRYLTGETYSLLTKAEKKALY